MRERVASVVVMVVLLAVRGEGSPVSGQRESLGEIACEGAVVAQAWELLASAHFGWSRRERAAFIVRHPDGAFEFDHWPFRGEEARASFQGTIPAGTVAIIHTHPNDSEYPSEVDNRLARRMGLPIYVVTRARISKVGERTVETIWGGNWDPRLGGRYASSRCGDASVAMTFAASINGNR